MGAVSSNRVAQSRSHCNSVHHNTLDGVSQDTQTLEQLSATSTSATQVTPAASLEFVEHQNGELGQVQPFKVMRRSAEEGWLLVTYSKLKCAETKGNLTDVKCILRELKDRSIMDKDLLRTTEVYGRVTGLTYFTHDLTVQRAAQELCDQWSTLLSTPDSSWLMGTIDKLISAMNKGQQSKIKAAIRDLNAHPIVDKDLFDETRVYVRVGWLTQHSDPEIQALAQELYDTWTPYFPSEAPVKPSANLPTPTIEGSEILQSAISEAMNTEADSTAASGAANTRTSQQPFLQFLRDRQYSAAAPATGVPLTTTHTNTITQPPAAVQTGSVTKSTPIVQVTPSSIVLTTGAATGPNLDKPFQSNLIAASTAAVNVDPMPRFATLAPASNSPNRPKASKRRERRPPSANALPAGFNPFLFSPNLRSIATLDDTSTASTTSLLNFLEGKPGTSKTNGFEDLSGQLAINQSVTDGSIFGFGEVKFPKPPKYDKSILNNLHKSTQPKAVLKGVINEETSKASKSIKALKELCDWVQTCTEIDPLSLGGWKASIENTHGSIQHYGDQLIKLVEANNELRVNAKIMEMDFIRLQDESIITSEQLEACQADLSQSRIEIATGKQKVIELQNDFELGAVVPLERLVKAEVSKLEIEQRLRKLQKESKEYKVLTTEKESEFGKTQLELTDVKAQLEKANQTLTSLRVNELTIKTKLKDVDQLKYDLKTKTEEAMAEKQSAMTLKVQVEVLERLKIDLEAKIGEAEIMKQSLKSIQPKLIELDQLKHELEAKTGEADAAKRSTTQKLRKFEQQVSDLTNHIKELEGTINLQKQARDKLKREKDEEAREKQSLEKSLQGTNNELREVRIAYDSTVQDLHNSKEEILQLRAALKSKQATSSTVTKEPDASPNDHFLKQEIMHIEEKILDAEKTKGTSQITLQDLEAEIAKITQEMEATEHDRAAERAAAQPNTKAPEKSHRPPPGRSEVAPPQLPKTRSRAASIGCMESEASSASPHSAPALPLLSPGPPPPAVELPVFTLDGPVATPDEVENRSETVANGRDQPNQWAQVARRASTRTMRIVPASTPSFAERRSIGNAQRGGRWVRGNCQNKGPNSQQAGTENATRGRGRRDYENFARNRRDGHNNANM